MTHQDHERIEGLRAKSLFRVALGDSAEYPEAAEEAAAREREVRAGIESRLEDLELLELLGAGGMGYVYRARQRKLGREVAVKVVAPDVERSADFTERFAREARALARLNHPNIVAVYDYGEDGSFGWLVMEYVDGSNLREVIRAGKLEPAEALALIPRLCDALQYAHDQGVVHRDVKPENILVDGEGGVKIADFGLAKLTGTPAALVNLTGTQQVLGTLRYMAPEQLDRPLEVDHRADIYSLGVVFYEMLTGEIPMGRFDPPSRYSSASTRVDEVVLRALERSPERRYQRASEVKSDLEAVGTARNEFDSPVREALAPTISIPAVGSVALFLVGLVPCSILALGLIHSMSQPETFHALEPDDSNAAFNLKGLILFAFGLFGLALMVSGSVLGFKTLKSIEREWPRVYGVGAAVVGAWGVVLLLANETAFGLLLFLMKNAELTPGPWIALLLPVLLGIDGLFLHWHRRRILARCGSRA